MHRRSVWIALLFLSLFNFVLAYCQPPMEWSKTFGGVGFDEGYCVIQTNDGGYALAGATASFGAGGQDFWLIKTDYLGNTDWSRTHGGSSDEWAYFVIQTDDGGYALAGGTKSFGAGNWDFWLVKTDVLGDMQWSQTYGGTSDDEAYFVIQTDDGGYALAGRTSSYAIGIYDAWFVKTDSNGNMEWTQTYGGTGDEDAFSVIQTDDGGYALAGRTSSFGAGGYDSWLIKTNSDGIIEWYQTYGGTGNENTRSLVSTQDGGYMLAGYTDSFGAGSGDFYLVKTDVNGNPIWTRTFGGTGDDRAESVVQAHDGGYGLVGYTYSLGAGDSDCWFLKTDVNGHEIWNQTYGGIGRDSAISLVRTTDGGHVLAGYTKSFGAGDSDAWLIKVSGPPQPPVGGYWMPTNKTELLVPWIGLALITVVTASIAYVKRRKRDQT